MAFEEVKENTENIKEQLQVYIDKNVDYIKLKSFKTLMQSSVTILKYLMILTLTLLFVLFASIALALELSVYFNSYAFGFLIVSGVYFILTLLFLSFSKNFLEKPLLIKFSKIFFND